ncbi:RHS repeat-associated core domain-containing protein [Pseudomonas sp. 5FOS]|jgi:RHS repeat-associated protein|uniref:RHS repeat-associated core domain-containing protein n=1 Tax=unclassified Pseudomonas TaxID=196821 RepID=UPI001A9D1945|nr:MULTISPECIES: RHS repeat-associated core domain-containing protein [unclassified Pseudomonas]MCE5985827.1 RHS repeat-associated core domain-containing protein [Pseudomonas sp. LM20]UMY60245.1 RHS repeat-associated core domain-containing protein [Pseudomonas sp. LS.1a]
MRDSTKSARAYAPFGHATPANNLLGFNGEIQHVISGLYPLGNGHRMYSPTLQRFHSPDTQAPFNRGGINHYAYCGNDPVNWRDPSGKWRQLVKTALKIAVGGGAAAAGKMNAEFVGDVYTTGKHALTRGPVPQHEFPLERTTLMQNANQARRPFNDSVNGVNFNLATWGDASLTERQARYYIDGTWSDQSNTTLYGYSAAGWLIGFAKTRQPGTLTGALFNAAGAAGAGVLDHVSYKTGSMLTQDFTRQTASIRQ